MNTKKQQYFAVMINYIGFVTPSNSLKNLNFTSAAAVPTITGYWVTVTWFIRVGSAAFEAAGFTLHSSERQRGNFKMKTCRFTYWQTLWHWKKERA